jgi:sulfate permease, SulP family
MPPKKNSVGFTPGDLSGGIASAIVSITGNVAAGVIAFAPLGPEYAGQGILAGMFSSIVAGLMAALFGGAPGMISGPKATTSMAFAALLSSLLATGRFDMSQPEQAHILLSLAFSAVLISGSVQILLGAFRVGTMVKFMPYPVVAGIRNTTAILLIYGQLWPFLGVPRQSLTALFENLGQIEPAMVLVAGLTALIAARGGKIMPKPAVPVMALILGTLLYYAFPLLGMDVRLGPVLGSLPSAIPKPAYLGGILSALTDSANIAVLGAVVSGALAIAVLDSISALITLVTYQSIADRRFDANNQLVGQGIGSAVSAFFGGLTTSGILARAAVNHGAGGRSRASGVVNAVGVLVLVVLLSKPLAMIPKAAIAGLIMVIAVGLFDRWSFGLLKEAILDRAGKRRSRLPNVLEMSIVVAVGVFGNLVAAVGAGVLVSVFVFVARMTRSPIRRVRTGATVRSARQRDERLKELLREHGDRIAVIELDGTIFFGSCDAVATRAETLADEGADFVLLDMRRVRSIDATGYKVLGQTYDRLKKSGTTLAFGYAEPDGIGADSEFAENLLLAGIPEARLFDTTDRALEYFEEGLLMKLAADDWGGEAWTVADFARACEMDEGEAAVFAKALAPHDYNAGEYVFRIGDTGRSMYFLSQGAADVVIPVPGEGRDRRLATFQRGTLFGEMALLDGLPRAASVRARDPLDCFELTLERFEELGRDHPRVAMKIQTTIGKVLGGRLRDTNALVLELDS